MYVISPCSYETYLSILAAHGTFWTAQGRSEYRRFILCPFFGAAYYAEAR